MDFTLFLFSFLLFSPLSLRSCLHHIPLLTSLSFLLACTLSGCIYVLASGGSTPTACFYWCLANKSTSSLTGLQLTLTTGHLGWERETGREGGIGERVKRHQGWYSDERHCKSMGRHEVENQDSYNPTVKLYLNLCLPFSVVALFLDSIRDSVLHSSL